MDFLRTELKELTMLSITKSSKADKLHGVVVVAFDRANGQVRGTYVHGSLGGADEAGVKSEGAQFVAKLKTRLGGKVELDTIQLPLEELKDAWVERVDLATRKAVKSTASRS
jgi:hypothetical protein